MPRRPASLLAAVLACVLVAGLPATASAAKRFRGESEQSRKVTLRVGDDGRATRLTIDWRAKCRSGKFVESEVRFPGGFFTTSTRDRLAGRGPYNAKATGGFRLRVQARVKGRRSFDEDDPGSESWSGTLRTTTVVRKNGKVVDRCRSRLIDWSAERQDAV